jgi:hypothetical protein
MLSSHCTLSTVAAEADREDLKALIFLELSMHEGATQDAKDVIIRM